ncbi:MAG: nitroreductase family protein, partial [Candidatus Eisenbacteria bacterium]|nr:nitroreductase family protein [Candidatus Eisenbacteria bacterium]
MDFAELIRKRYSVRAYRPLPVEEQKLNAILEAGRLAPTAANRQPFKIIVIKPQGREEQLKRIYDADWFVAAPIILAVIGTPSKNWKRKDGKNYNDVDTAIVMDHIVLQATDLGLGTCWIGAFDPQAARSVLGLPADVEPIAFTPLGYAADSPKAKHRRPLAELSSSDR